MLIIHPGCIFGQKVYYTTKRCIFRKGCQQGCICKLWAQEKDVFSLVIYVLAIQESCYMVLFCFLNTLARSISNSVFGKRARLLKTLLASQARSP